MPKGKTIHTKEYPVFLELLGKVRQTAGLTQVQLANLAGLSQPYVSSVERGVLRLDTLQLRTWLRACGSDLGTFGAELEKRLKVFDTSTAQKGRKPIQKTRPRSPR